MNGRSASAITYKRGDRPSLLGTFPAPPISILRSTLQQAFLRVPFFDTLTVGLALAIACLSLLHSLSVLIWNVFSLVY